MNRITSPSHTEACFLYMQLQVYPCDQLAVVPMVLMQREPSQAQSDILQSQLFIKQL